jgi:hypothetical protein
VSGTEVKPGERCVVGKATGIYVGPSTRYREQGLVEMDRYQTPQYVGLEQILPEPREVTVTLTRSEAGLCERAVAALIHPHVTEQMKCRVLRQIREAMR